MLSCDDLIYKEKDVPYDCYQVFRDMRQKKEFCDVTLNIGNDLIHAHKVILAACIPYFRTLFGHSGKEDQKKEAFLTDVCPEALEALIDFAYTCELKITSENAQTLLTAACYLQVHNVKKACVKFLINRLYPADALSLRDLGFRLDCPDLVNKSDDYVRKNFVVVSECEGFQSLPYSYLKDLISSDDLDVGSEEKVFEAIIRWVKAQPDERSSELPQLLSSVRMPFLKLYYLRDVIATDELVKGSLQCRDILDDARDYHLFPEKRHDTSVVWKFVCTPRRYRKNTSENESVNQEKKIVPQFSPKSGGDFTKRSSKEAVAVQSKKISNFLNLWNVSRMDNLISLKKLTSSTGEVPVCKTLEQIALVPSDKISTSPIETKHEDFNPNLKLGTFNFIKNPDFSLQQEGKISTKRPKAIATYRRATGTVEKPKLFSQASIHA